MLTNTQSRVVYIQDRLQRTYFIQCAIACCRVINWWRLVMLQWSGLWDI